MIRMWELLTWYLLCHKLHDHNKAVLCTFLMFGEMNARVLGFRHFYGNLITRLGPLWQVSFRYHLGTMSINATTGNTPDLEGTLHTEVHFLVQLTPNPKRLQKILDSNIQKLSRYSMQGIVSLYEHLYFVA